MQAVGVSPFICVEQPTLECKDCRNRVYIIPAQTKGDYCHKVANTGQLHEFTRRGGTIVMG